MKLQIFLDCLYILCIMTILIGYIMVLVAVKKDSGKLWSIGWIVMIIAVSRDEFIEALNRIAYEHQLLDDYDNFLVKQNAFIKNLIKSRGGRIFTTEAFRSSELHDNAFDNLTYLTNICFEIENKS